MNEGEEPITIVTFASEIPDEAGDGHRKPIDCAEHACDVRLGCERAAVADVLPQARQPRGSVSNLLYVHENDIDA
jgi:hypothetical protein